MNLLFLTLSFFLQWPLLAKDHKEYAIGNLATIYDILPENTQNVIESNFDEVSDWQPYGNVDSGLLDPQSAAIQRKWNEWNAHITAKGNIDSARLLVSFGLLPILSSTGNDLHSAVTIGDLEKVKDLLTNPKYTNMDIDSEKSDGSTALIIAAIMNHVEIADFLLSEGAYTEQKSSSGATALHFAASLNHTEIVDLLVNKYNADCDTPHSFASSTALHFAVEMNHAHVIEMLCSSNKCNVEAEKSHGGRAIHIAAEANCSDALIALIEKCDVDLESQLLNDTTALYLAALNGLTEMVKILINHGAKLDPVMPVVARRDLMGYKDKMNNKYGSPNIPNPEFDGMYYPDKNMEIGNGATPLHAAVENGHYDTVKVLLDAGARQLGSMEGANPLYVAVEYNQYKIAKLLLKYDGSKSNIDHKIPKNGHSSLYLAVGQNRIKFIKLLIRNGANINVQTKGGITPLYYAAVRSRPNIIEILLKHMKDKKDVSRYVADDGSNAIHAAAQYNCIGCINLLAVFDPKLLRSTTDNNENIFHLLFNRKKKHSVDMIRDILDFAEHHEFDLLNQRSKQYGYTPFHAVVSNGHVKIAKLFVEYGANMDAKANKKLFGATPLFIACQNDDKKMVKFLVKNGADCNVKLVGDGREHISPIFVAAEKGYKEIVNILLTECKDIKLQEDVDENEDEMKRAQQMTPIHVACMNGHVDVVKSIVKLSGVGISVMDKRADSTETGIRDLTMEEIEPFCMNVYNRKKNVQTNSDKKEL